MSAVGSDGGPLQLYAYICVCGYVYLISDACLDGQVIMNTLSWEPGDLEDTSRLLPFALLSDVLALHTCCHLSS